MSEQTVKTKNLGSIYFNARKNADEGVRETIAQAVEVLKENEAYLTISIRKRDSDDYVKLTGFFNNYRKSDREPDVVIRPTMVATEPRKEYPKKDFKKPFQKKSFTKPAKPAPAANSEEGFDDDNPFA